jgi:hypothetical protein
MKYMKEAYYRLVRFHSMEFIYNSDPFFNPEFCYSHSALESATWHA